MSAFHDAFESCAFSDEKMAKVNLFESSRMFCDVYGLEPGQVQKAHVHDDNDKIYCVMSGTCQVTIGDEERLLRTGQVAVAAAGVVHGLENIGSERTTLVVVMAPHPSFDG